MDFRISHASANPSGFSFLVLEREANEASLLHSEYRTLKTAFLFADVSVLML